MNTENQKRISNLWRPSPQKPLSLASEMLIAAASIVLMTLNSILK